MQQVWKKPTQMNRVLLTELQDKRSVPKVEAKEASMKNTETLPGGMYTELAKQRSLGIATSKGCERPRKASIDTQEQAEGTEYSCLFCAYRAVLMFGFPTDISELSCRKRKLRWESYCRLHLPKIGGCMQDESRLSFRLHKRRTGGYRQVAMGEIEILGKKKITVKVVQHC